MPKVGECAQEASQATAEYSRLTAHKVRRSYTGPLALRAAAKGAFGKGCIERGCAARVTVRRRPVGWFAVFSRACHAAPTWMVAHPLKIPDASATVKALEYSLSRWNAFVRYLDNGKLLADSNNVENQFAPFALGRSSRPFARSLRVRKRAAAIVRLAQSERIFEHDPYAASRSPPPACRSCLEWGSRTCCPTAKWPPQVVDGHSNPVPGIGRDWFLEDALLPRTISLLRCSRVKHDSGCSCQGL